MKPRTLGSLALFAMLAAACHRAPGPDSVAVVPLQPDAPLQMSEPGHSGEDPHTPVAPPRSTPNSSGAGDSGPCEADSDCPEGDTCVARIDYGGCKECAGGSVIRRCEQSDRQSADCPAGLDCEPSADGDEDPRCHDPQFRKRCPNTVIGL